MSSEQGWRTWPKIPPLRKDSGRTIYEDGEGLLGMAALGSECFFHCLRYSFGKVHLPKCLPTELRHELFVCFLIRGKAAAGDEKKRFRFCSMCRGLSVTLGRTVPAQPLFPGCFQPHQVLSREAPGAQYFAGTGCIYLPMSGFRD